MFTAAPRPRLEVADILRTHGSAYCARHPVSSEQAAVIRHLTACRTAALGGHIDICDACGFLRVSYNSCRDRHCPKCQAAKQTEWLAGRLEQLLPVEYFHVVFTLPQQIKPLTLKNRRLLYDLLFRAASQTLLELAADAKRLSAQIGVTAVLHTWGQNLLFHPHLHCVVTGGGLAHDGTRWIPARQGFLLPVKVLAKLFRDKFLAGLKEAYRSRKLQLTGSVSSLGLRSQEEVSQLTLWDTPSDAFS
ncbi:MAG: transposase zinc-binding domain-containing protein [Planctomycetaceae bacterium]